MKLFVLAMTLVFGFAVTAMADDAKKVAQKDDDESSTTEEVKTIEAKVVKSKDGETADATTTTCTHGTLVRRIEIVFEDPTTRVPCEVHYKKETEQPGHDQVLWTAQNDAEYCETKVREFVEKQQGWGWECQAGK